jgi:hypothetical protein
MITYEQGGGDSGTPKDKEMRTMSVKNLPEAVGSLSRRSLFGAFLASFCLTAFGQAVIENPEEPPSPRAGRVVKLKEVWPLHFRIKTEDRHNYYAPMALLDNFLFVIEITEDDLISVVKYEIIDQ